VKTKTAIGSIQSINIPENFIISKERYGDMAASWLLCYSPVEDEQIEIGFLYRGKALYVDDAKSFRKLINQPSQVLFADDTSGAVFEKQKELLDNLYFVFGDIGNNQITNDKKGLEGPRFFLERLETLSINGRRVLSVKGWFHNIQLTPQNYYYGLMFDRNRLSDQCHLEELYFQAHSQIQYDKYFFEFTNCLKTIIWA